MTVRPATPDELADWDELAVDPPGGHVYQSRAWAAHRAATGWMPHQLVVDDSHRVLALTRPWPFVGGGSAYIPRGPIAAGSPPDAIAQRLVAVTEHLAEAGIDVVASDSEVPADSGYPDRLRAGGFHPIEEIQPSRHRVSLALDGRGEDDIFSGISKSTRQRIRKAEDDIQSIVRHDGRVAPDGVGEGFARPSEPVEVALDRFYDLLLETGERKQFTFGPRDLYVDWWRAAVRAGHLVYLEAWGIRGSPIAGLLLYRHGERMSTVHSGDHAEDRAENPGALHLLRWRAMQLAIREGRSEMDLGGADIAGARREPREGEPMYGLYQHKVSFGGRWLELTGAHEKVIHPNRYLAGRLASRAARILVRGKPAA